VDNIVTEKLICSGVASCAGIDLSVSGSSIGSNVRCTSGRSCRSATLVAPEYIKCDALNSCAAASLVTETANCFGLQGCSRATIVSETAYCRGSEACVQSTINAALVWGFGNKAMQNAKIETSEVDGTEITIIMQGYEAGDGAEIHCRDGYKCTLNCYGNSCAGLQFYAYDGSEVNLLCNAYPCTCDDDNMHGLTACPDFPIGIPTLDVLKNEILSVKDDVKYSTIWKTIPTAVYGVLLFGISLCVMLIYSFHIKGNRKEYQIIV